MHRECGCERGGVDGGWRGGDGGYRSGDGGYRGGDDGGESTAATQPPPSMSLLKHAAVVMDKEDQGRGLYHRQLIVHNLNPQPY